MVRKVRMIRPKRRHARSKSILAWLCILGLALLLADASCANAPADSPSSPGREALLDVARGQIPNDTGSDGATKMSIEECEALGGKALRVVYASGDSFGDRQARVEDWSPFGSLRFDAFNSAQENVRLTLTVKHARTTDYQTRVDVPVTLKPGRNSVEIKIAKMLNVNGIEWAISVAPDPRIPVLHEELRKVRGSAFEVVVAPEE